MVITLTLFIFGFFILVKSANFLIKESSIIARYLGVPSLVIGILVLGIGTSIPEFAVTFFSNIVGQNEIGLGTIIGSNIFNFLFILGLCVLFYPLYFKKEWINRDLVWGAAAVFAVILVALNGIITRFEGLFLLILCIIWIITIARNHNEKLEYETTTSTLLITFLLSIAGLLGVLFGSYFVVNGAVAIATNFGFSEIFVGLIIVGIGTSLPEIIVSLTAAKNREYGMAIGNVIGSNIFDFLGIIGVSALAIPMYFDKKIIVELFIAMATVGIVAFLVLANKQYRLGRLHGVLLLSIFVLYFIFIVLRG